MPGDPGGDGLAPPLDLLPGTRQIFEIAVESAQNSCGWGVRVMTMEKERDTMVKWHVQKDPEEWLRTYQGRTHSIDGIPTRPTDRFISGE